MYIVIVEGKQRNIMVETGVDLDADIIPKKEGESKYEFMMTKIPCLVEFSDGGGITSAILTKIFKTLDSLGIYDKDRTNGLRLFVMLDGHPSRFDIDFLTYMNDDNHR
jgi:hypothetical protein